MFRAQHHRTGIKASTRPLTAFKLTPECTCGQACADKIRVCVGV